MTRKSEYQWSQDGGWRLSKSGLYHPASHYYIEKSRLLRTRGEGDKAVYEWPVHMAEKEWVHFGAFLDIFLMAIRDLPEFSERMWRRSVHEAMRERSSRPMPAADADLQREIDRLQAEIDQRMRDSSL